MSADAVEQAYREHWSRLLALLVTRVRRFDVAEDALQEAYAAAARVWPAGGVPDNPAAWLLTAARRRVLDLLRREENDRRRVPLLVTGDAGASAAGDEELRLLYACCHPALSPDGRAAMMLRFVAGLPTAEVAQLMLVPEATMAARLTRAKRKIAAAGIPLRTPDPADLPERLGVVLKVLYLIFTAGYRSGTGPDLLRPRVCAAAIRLAYLLPPEPQVVALLALMVLQHARRGARVLDARLVLLDDQDRSRWRHDEIARGRELLAGLGPDVLPGEYHLQALIAAEHTGARHWERIAGWYAELERRTASPVVRLNRAVAVAEAGDPAAALALIEGLPATGHLVPAVRGELLLRLDRRAEAADAFDVALALVKTDPERDHLHRRRALAEP